MRLLLRVDGWEALAALVFMFVVGLLLGYLLGRRR